MPSAPSTSCASGPTAAKVRNSVLGSMARLGEGEPEVSAALAVRRNKGSAYPHAHASFPKRKGAAEIGRIPFGRPKDFGHVNALVVPEPLPAALNAEKTALLARL